MRKWTWFSTLIFLFISVVFNGCSGGGDGGSDSQTGPDPPPATGDTPIQLDTLNQFANLHVLTVNRAGDHAAVWESKDATGDQLWVTSRQTGGAWGSPQLWAEVDAIFSGDVLAALRDTQQSVLVWDEGSFTFAQVQPRANGGTPSLLVEGGELTRLALAATMDEPVVVLWRESGTLQTSTSAAGGVWTLPQPVPLLSTAEVAIDPEGVAPAPVQAELGVATDGSRVVVWRNFAEMRAIRWIPSQGWAEPIVLRETDTLIGDFALSVSANGTAVVLWCERSAPGPRDLLARHFTGSVWTPAVLVAPAQCPARSPNLQVQSG